MLLFGGIAVAGTGVVLFILDPGNSDSDTPTASLGCLPGACYGSVSVKF